MIANAVALSDAMTSRDYDYDSLPWPDRWDHKEHRRENELYRSIIEMRVLQETEPLPLSWSQVGSDESAERAISWFRPDVVVPAINVEFPPRAMAVRRSEPDQDADDPSDDIHVSVLSAPRTIDPEVFGDARNRHNRTVRLIHQLLRTRRKRPIKPVGWFGEQPDVVWREYPGFQIVEVKGITGLNEREQLRLGLGQVLRYRFISEKQGHRTQAWLVTDAPAADLLWMEICDSLNVRLWWPGSTVPGPGDPQHSGPA